MIRPIVLGALLVAALPAFAADRTPSPPGAAVYIISPADGATVSSPVTVQFGLKGMGVAPAGIGSSSGGSSVTSIRRWWWPVLSFSTPAGASPMPLRPNWTVTGLWVATFCLALWRLVTYWERRHPI